MAHHLAERLDERSVTTFPHHAKPSSKLANDKDEIAVYLAKMTFELNAIAR